MNPLHLFEKLLDEPDQTKFLQLFSCFCRITLPPNPKLRESLIACIQHSSRNSVALKPVAWYQRESLLPPLPQAWQQTAFMLVHSKDINTNLLNIQASSLHVLRPGNVLDYDLVEAYAELIRREGVMISSSRLFENGGSDASRSFIDQNIDYQQVCCGGQFFIPIYQSNRRHWSFVRLLSDPSDTESLLAELYDSLEGCIPPSFAIWYQRRFARIPLRGVIAKSPKQQAGNVDCGLFMLMGIRLLSAGSCHLEQAEANELIPLFRYRVLAELLAGNLNPSITQHGQFLSMRDKALSNQAPEIDDDDTTEIDDDDNGSMEDSSLDGTSTDTELLQFTPLLENSSNDRLQFVNTCVANFANENSMIEFLTISVAQHRNADTDESTYQGLQFFYKKLETDHVQPRDILKSRYFREEYSRLFYQTLKDHGAKHRSTRAVRSQVAAILQVKLDSKSWRAAQSQASRSSIWTELVDFFRQHLEFPLAALCGADVPTGRMEGMNKSSRELFFRGLGRRMRDPEDKMLTNLKAASALIQSLLHGHLPDFTLAVERKTDLEVMNFVAAVSLEERLPLPDSD